MERGDAAGALAAAEYFMSLYGFAIATGDLTAWDQVSAADCQFCSAVRSDISRVYSAGGRFKDGEIAFTDAAVLPQNAELGGFPVEFAFEAAAGTELDGSGTVVEESPAESGFVIVDVVYAGPGWQLVEVSTSEASRR